MSDSRSLTGSDQESMEKGKPPEEEPLAASGVLGMGESSVFTARTALQRSPVKVAPIFSSTSTSTATSAFPLEILKRRGSPLNRARSTSLTELPLVAGKRAKLESEPMNRLLSEIVRLNELIKATATTKNEIKVSAQKVRKLFDIAHLELAQQQQAHELCHNPSINVELCDGATQTPSSISKLCETEFILISKGDPTKQEEILNLDWPKDAYECTRMVKGGMIKTRPATARAIICATGLVSQNETLSRLGQSLPSLKRINDSNLQTGKVAVVRCGEEIEIDGEKTNDGSQCIVVAAVETPVRTPGLLEAMKKITEHAVKSRSDRLIISLPKDTDNGLARKILELSLFGRGITGEIIADKQQRKAQQRNGHHPRGATEKTSSFTIIPEGEATLADIVKGMQEDVNPSSMGIKVHSMRETRSGGVQVIFQNNRAKPTAFFDRVQQCVASKATCHLRKGAVIVQGIEAAYSENQILSRLAEALDVTVDKLQAGRISTSNRGRSLVVTMTSDLVALALRIKHIQQCWTRAYIREKIDPDFCDNCQEYGHLPRNCSKKSPLPKRCFNCGVPGHLKTVCAMPAACFSCKVEGHRSNSMACPLFRAMVQDKRQQRNG